MSKFGQASPSSPRLESIKRPTRFHDTPPWTKVKASVDDVTGIGSHKSQQTSVQKTIGGAGQTAVWGSNWEPAEICFQKMIAALTTDNNVSFPPSLPPSVYARDPFISTALPPVVTFSDPSPSLVDHPRSKRERCE